MIKSHQHLLEKYYRAQTRILWDYHGDIDSGMSELISEIEEYAEGQDLDTAFLRDDKQIYQIQTGG